MLFDCRPHAGGFRLAVLSLLLAALAAAPIAQARESIVLDEQDIEIDGLNLHYRTGGSGPWLLLLHGFSLSGTESDAFLPDFLQDFTVVVPDLPGHGGSDPLPGDFSWRKTARIMLALMDDLGATRMRGIGHSAGAITLLHMVAQQPGRMPAMVLVAGAHRMSNEGRNLLRGSRFDSLDAESRSFYMALPGRQ